MPKCQAVKSRLGGVKLDLTMCTRSCTKFLNTFQNTYKMYEIILYCQEAAM